MQRLTSSTLPLCLSDPHTTGRYRPNPGQRPLASTPSAIDGMVASTMAILPNTDGSSDAYVSNLTQLILDISRYFAPQLRPYHA